MHHPVRLALSICGVAVLIGWLAPVASAMIPLPDPAGASPVVAATTTALAVWQAIAIAFVAVAIGAVGALIAQRLHRADGSPATVA